MRRLNINCYCKREALIIKRDGYYMAICSTGEETCPTITGEFFKLKDLHECLRKEHSVLLINHHYKQRITL